MSIQVKILTFPLYFPAQKKISNRYTYHENKEWEERRRRKRSRRRNYFIIVAAWLSWNEVEFIGNNVKGLNSDGCQEYHLVSCDVKLSFKLSWHSHPYVSLKKNKSGLYFITIFIKYILFFSLSVSFYLHTSSWEKHCWI